MKTSKELALEFAKERKQKEEKTKSIIQEQKERLDKEEKALLNALISALNSYREDFCIVKVINNEHEWVIQRLDSRLVLLSIRLILDEGYFDGSDEVKNVPYINWAIVIIKGDIDTVSYITKPQEVSEKLAKEISKYY